MKKTFRKSFILWLPFAAMITFVCLLGYGLVQQDLRQTANDPQVQIVEDVAVALSSGSAAPQDIVPPGQSVDISTSLDPYVIISDASGTVLASSASLHGATPTVPNGVFANVRQNGEDRFTWQPQGGVRSAVVVRAWSGTAGSGFVLAGRSLREIEIREDNILRLTELAWLAGLVVMFGIIWSLATLYKEKVA